MWHVQQPLDFEPSTSSGNLSMVLAKHRTGLTPNLNNITDCHSKGKIYVYYSKTWSPCLSIHYLKNCLLCLLKLCVFVSLAWPKCFYLHCWWWVTQTTVTLHDFIFQTNPVNFTALRWGRNRLCWCPRGWWTGHRAGLTKLTSAFMASARWSNILITFSLNSACPLGKLIGLTFLWRTFWLCLENKAIALSFQDVTSDSDFC